MTLDADDPTAWEDDAEGWREFYREEAERAERERLTARAAEVYRAAGRPVPAWLAEMTRAA